MSSNKDKLSSRLDRTSGEARLPSRLDQSCRENFSSRPGHSRRDQLPSRLDDPTSRPGPSTSRPSIKTAFTSEHDIKMASRQTKIDSLPPAERKKQEEWAQKKIKEFAPCPAGFDWLRVPGGYNCTAGSHWMTDELLAEGKVGYYIHREVIKPMELEDIRRNNKDLMSVAARMKEAHKRAREVGFSQGLEKFDGQIYVRGRGGRFQGPMNNLFDPSGSRPGWPGLGRGSPFQW